MLNLRFYVNTNTVYMRGFEMGAALELFTLYFYSIAM
jgi:hypothetical protein